MSRAYSRLGGKCDLFFGDHTLYATVRTLREAHEEDTSILVVTFDGNETYRVHGKHLSKEEWDLVEADSKQMFDAWRSLERICRLHSLPLSTEPEEEPDTPEPPPEKPTASHSCTLL